MGPEGTHSLGTDDIAPLFGIASDSTDFDNLQQAFLAITRLPLHPSAWVVVAALARWYLNHFPQDSPQFRRIAMIAAAIPVRSLREELAFLAKKTTRIVSLDIATSLAENGDASTIPILLGEIKDSMIGHLLAGIPLERGATNAKNLKDAFISSDFDGKVWISIALARMGDFEPLEKILEALLSGNLEPRGNRRWFEPLGSGRWDIYEGRESFAYELLATLRPLPAPVHAFLMERYPGPGKLPRAAEVFITALTGVADAQGRPIFPEPERPPADPAFAEVVAARLIQKPLNDALRLNATPEEILSLSALPPERAVAVLVALIEHLGTVPEPPKPRKYVFEKFPRWKDRRLIDLACALPSPLSLPLVELLERRPSRLRVDVYMWVLSRAGAKEVVVQLGPHAETNLDPAGRKRTLEQIEMITRYLNVPRWVLPKKGPLPRPRFVPTIDDATVQSEIGASEEPEIVQASPPSEVITVETSGTEPRYADAAFFAGGKSSNCRLQPTEALIEQRWYLLEVAVRTKVSGVLGERHPIREPRQSEPVKVLVTLEAEGNSFDLKDPVQELTLPPKGNSTQNAWFEVRPRQKSPSADAVAKLVVRLFYRMNLIESFVIRAEVAGSLDSPVGSRFGSAAPIALEPAVLQREYADFDDLMPREMHINVRRQGEEYSLTFTLVHEVGKSLALTGITRLDASSVEDALEGFRRGLEALTTNPTYLDGLKGKQTECQTALHELATIGHTLWVRLFKDRPNSAMDVIGRRLEQQPLRDGALIQVLVEDDARKFLFPWGLLYDRAVSDKPYETGPDGFWGLRYPIEQYVGNYRPDSDTPKVPDPEIRLVFMLWDAFRNAPQQIRMMTSLTRRAAGKLTITPPVMQKEQFYEAVRAPAQILYFYTHGHTRRQLQHSSAGTELLNRMKRYDEFPKPAQEMFKSIRDEIAAGRYEIDRSWIELRHGMLYLDEMQEKVPPQLSGNPLVVLNMCESAQVIPSLTDSFVDFFLLRGACAVVGTECPMTVEFAHPFGQRFLEGVLAGRPVGEVLVDARRHFLIVEHNPLGLAYTLFGSATARFSPPLLAA